MSALTDLIAKALTEHPDATDRSADDGCWCREPNTAGRYAEHAAEVVAAVIADWLDGLADEHNAKIALIAGVEFQPHRRDASTAHGMRRAAAEARKGSDQ